jgi:DNA mismatch repair ATPase MutS
MFCSLRDTIIYQMFNGKKKIREALLASFGNIKDESFNFDFIEKYFRNKDNTEAYQILSDKTCNDLDFQELFMFLDRTTSRIGQQYLYNKLRTIPRDNTRTESGEKIINEIISDPSLRLKLQLELNKLKGINSYFISSLFQDEHIKPPNWFFIIPLLSFTAFLSVLTLKFIPQALFILIPVFIANFIIHFWNKRNLHDYIGSIPQLLILKDVASGLLKYDIFSEINSGISDSIKIIDKVRNRMLFFKLEANISGDAQVAFWSMLEIVKSMFLLEPLLLFGALKQLDTRRKEIESVFEFTGYIDSLISIASLRNGLELYCTPELSYAQRILKADEVYHPLIIDCVSNSININHKSILLTGSNMSGKTSFIRTIGINAITGLTINTCFARHFSISRLRVYSAIRISDDLMNDKSYYFEEVLTIKDMIDKSQTGDNNLFLLDEIFKGTNTIERISAGKAVLSYLNSPANIVFVSTHDIELTELLKESYELYHFSEKVDNKTVAFDFRLKDGKLKNRNAIKILEINDYPEKIIREAIELSGEFDKNSAYIFGKKTK